VFASQTFLEYRLQQMAHGQKLFRTAPDWKLQDAFTGASLLVLSDLMHSRVAGLFDQRLSEVANQYHFMNLSCHSGIIHGVSFLHAAVTNRSCLDGMMPSEPRKNVNSAADYCLFFQDISRQLRQNECELCGTVCENLQAQVIGVEQLIRDHDGVSVPVMHVACCSYMINLVFLYSLRRDSLFEMKTNLKSIVQIFQTHQGCPISVFAVPNGTDSLGLYGGCFGLHFSTLS
jgi:hypothetical protein